MLYGSPKHLWYLILAGIAVATSPPPFVLSLFLGTAGRYVLHVIMNALAKWDGFAEPTRIIRKNPPANQLERELDYDNAFIFSVGAFLVVKWMTPFLDAPVGLTWRSVALCAAGHFVVTEPVYYAFHRWMHWPGVYQKTHFHHHTSIIPEPNSGTSHPILENMAYMANFSAAFLVPAFFGHYSDALIGPYFILFDFLNIIGHSNFEWMPRWWWDTPLKYLLYTTCHHSLHHSRFKCNYVLFCPLWDFLGGTVCPETETLFRKVHAQGLPPLDVVFICHGLTHTSLLHNPHLSPYLASRGLQKHWWDPLALLVLGPVGYIAPTVGKCYSVQRYRFGTLRCATWTLPRLGHHYANQRAHPGINRDLVASINAASESGATHVGLAALNKAHTLNDHGATLIGHLKPASQRAKVVHGNTLTTAVVWDILRNALPPCSNVVITGATSMIGAALIRLLLTEGQNCSSRGGYTIQALTGSQERFEALRRGTQRFLGSRKGDLGARRS